MPLLLLLKESDRKARHICVARMTFLTKVAPIARFPAVIGLPFLIRLHLEDLRMLGARVSRHQD